MHDMEHIEEFSNQLKKFEGSIDSQKYSSIGK